MSRSVTLSTHFRNAIIPRPDAPMSQSLSDLGCKLHVNLKAFKRSLANRCACAPIKTPLVADKPEFHVVFEDEWILVLNKPSGIKHEPLHRFVGGSLVNQVIGYLGKEPYTFHRLDKFTSGVMVFGKVKEIMKPLYVQNTAGKVKKKYLVLCVGLPSSQKFSVDAPIGRDVDHKFARQVTEDGQNALTHFSLLASNKSSRVSLLEATLSTGRTHQIRIHCRHAGIPVLGDELYGCSPLLWDGVYGPQIEPGPVDAAMAINRDVAVEESQSDAGPIRPGELSALHWLNSLEVQEDGMAADLLRPMQRQSLHAWSLSFSHPMSGEVCTFQAQPPKDYLAAMMHFRFVQRNPTI